MLKTIYLASADQGTLQNFSNVTPINEFLVGFRDLKGLYNTFQLIDAAQTMNWKTELQRRMLDLTLWSKMN